jgi:glycosyltransferase involved in cell wall biosynthesis
VVTISDFNKRFITDMAGDHYADKIQMVHCGVDTILFRPTEAPRRPGVFRIVSVGRLVEMKGQRHLVEACRLLNERGIPFECAIIGAGPLEGALRRQIAEAGLEGRVQLAGGQARDAVLARVREADVVVQPSVITPGGRMEGIPVALMEALACERAVIATRVSGIPELVHDGVSGLLVEAGDAIALAEALARLKHDPELRARLGAAGRRTVLAEFDLNANSALVRELFAEYHGHANAPR